MWAKLRWRGDGYLLTSDELTEPFFNHAGTLGCRAMKSTADWAERELSRRGMSSTFLGFEDCAADCLGLERAGMLREGFRADIVVVKGDPEKDVRALAPEKVIHVMKSGRLV